MEKPRQWKPRRDLMIVLVPVVLSYAVGLGVLRYTINQNKADAANDARIEREATLHLAEVTLDLCRQSNEQMRLVRTVLVRALQPPPIESYSYIEDPVFREAVHAQSVQNRAALQRQIEEGLVDQNCTESPPPLPPTTGG